jgi:signal transduction histidine kinase/AmiR/NasT family two-component response regulator
MVERAPATKILLVADDLGAATDVEQTLRGLGYDVIATVASADEALAASTRFCPALALVDIDTRGERDGIETAVLLRERFGVAVVFLAVHADDATLERSKRAEPLGFVTRPSHARELKSVIEIALHRHNLENALRKHDHWASSALHALADPVVTTDADGAISFMNTAAEALSGMSAEQTHGKRIADVFGGTRDIKDFRVSMGQGEVVVFRDTSEIKRLEQRALMAEKLASIGTLAAGVAHEINNPLAYVIGNLDFLDEQLDLLGERPSPAMLEELRSALKDVRDGTVRIRDIVSDLRLLAARDNESNIIDLQACVRWAVRVTQSQYKSVARVEVQLEEIAHIVGNESRLAQVLVNLITNAAQAIGPGHRDENLIAVRVYASKDWVHIDVRDTGPGIPPENLAKVFDPFFTTKDKGVGTGLGLTICQGIIQGMEGSLVLESQVALGTTVRITLPKRYAEGETPTQTRP